MPVFLYSLRTRGTVGKPAVLYEVIMILDISTNFSRHPRQANGLGGGTNIMGITVAIPHAHLHIRSRS